MIDWTDFQHPSQANILVNDRFDACLADFGLASVLYDTGTASDSNLSRGTLRWMAPELLINDDNSDGGRPSAASDMYALAMVLWEVSLPDLP
jgi:serine/threonine protein kinase